MASNPSRKVFVVHGRDEGKREAVCRLLERLQLAPIVLHEQPNQGRTVIEKCEDHADVDFGVVLITSDDLGKLTDAQELKPRARQNVILELGYFIGKLGRSRVCALYEDGVELPSDIPGIAYVSLGNSWQFELARELKAAQIEVDLNKLSGPQHGSLQGEFDQARLPVPLADVRVSLVGPSRDAKFVVANRGDGPARNIDFKIKRQEGRSSPLLRGDYDEKLPIPELLPGDRVTFIAALTCDTGTSFNTIVTWTNADGLIKQREAKVFLD